MVAKKADSLYPVVSGASIVAKVNEFQIDQSSYIFLGNSHCFYDITLLMIQVTRDRALRNWVFDEIAENMHREFGSRYP